MASFRGVAPVLHLPVDRSDDIRYDHFAPLIDRLIEFGVDALGVLGLATETWALTEHERDEVCVAAADAVGGRVPLTAGLDGATRLAVERGRRAIERGADRLMVRPPSGSAPSDLVTHFQVLARELDVPMVVQDSPQTTGVELTPEDLLAIADAHPHVRAVKVEEPHAGAKISRLATAGLDVVAGWGGLHYLESLSRGAVGCMPGCDLGPAFVEIQRRYASGDRGRSDELYRQILPLLVFEAQSLTLLVTGAKLALVRSGVFRSAAMRAPATSPDGVQLATFEALFTRLHQDGVPGW